MTNTSRIKPSEIRVGMEIRANVWGLSKTVAKTVTSVEQASGEAY